MKQVILFCGLALVLAACSNNTSNDSTSTNDTTKNITTNSGAAGTGGVGAGFGTGGSAGTDTNTTAAPDSGKQQ